MVEQPSKHKDPTVSVEPIKTICNVTRYPEACFTDLSSLNASKNPDPESFLNLSLRVSITHLLNLASSIKSLNDLHSQPGLEDCLTLFDDALSKLNDSVSTMNACMGLCKKKTSDIQTWISAAMTDQDTCNDGLEELGWTGGDEVKSRARSFKESPHIVPSTLRVKRPEPSLKAHGSNPGLERADQIYATRTRLGGSNQSPSNLMPPLGPPFENFTRREWDWDRLATVLPRHALEKIAAIPPPNPSWGDDNHLFSTPSAYAAIHPMASNGSQLQWKLHTVPSALGVRRPEPSLELNSWLGRG
ncbi:hypothetical protein V6N11_078452 [Hibiscus sabdariffa]|uniref:Pectinesterase inhibitor domain-containing protein n=1 Tax=Hibiscus sabdariffa TaxID=183260 RepID=A0ABR2TG25_9ROSI